MTWKQYHRLEDIHQFLDYLAKTYPAHISIQSIGKSHEGRDLKVGIVFLWQSLNTKFFELNYKKNVSTYLFAILLILQLLKISDGKPSNKAVFIDGGIHAREWISPATVTYFINQIAENFDVESDDFKNIDW